MRWFNKSGEKTVFGKILKICGKNTTMNLSAMLRWSNKSGIKTVFDKMTVYDEKI